MKALEEILSMSRILSHWAWVGLESRPVDPCPAEEYSRTRKGKRERDIRAQWRILNSPSRPKTEFSAMKGHEWVLTGRDGGSKGVDRYIGVVTSAALERVYVRQSC